MDSHIPNKALAKMIDACIDASMNLYHISNQIKIIQNDIDELSVTLNAYYKEND